MNPLPKTCATRDLQRRYRAIIDSAKKTREPVVLINNSAPEAVLLDIETYNQLTRDEYAWDEAFVLKQVAVADRSSRSGASKHLDSWDDLD
ncbi:MAG: type II toxin-antitoxin system Phd/YefM family antitoxin [Candidatus Uhrbacteria bacterium]|nr:type II toxin-antitoxin system Phd/YefM family antitoxin [Candidatus Uhrbacteria bacterium]